MGCKRSETFREYIDLQSQAIYVDKKKFKRTLHILKDGASCVQVGAIELGNYLKFVINMIKLKEVDDFIHTYVMMPSSL